MSIRPQVIRKAIGVLLLMVWVQTSAAQSLLPGNEYIHQYARVGRPTINVFIWGVVGTPGVWRVEQDVDLIELLSAARVLGVGSEDPDVRQTIMLRIYREQGDQRGELYYEDLDRILDEGRTYPILQEGDIIKVEVKRRNKLSFRTVTQIIGTAASLTLLVLRIIGT